MVHQRTQAQFLSHCLLSRSHSDQTLAPSRMEQSHRLHPQSVWQWVGASSSWKPGEYGAQELRLARYQRERQTDRQTDRQTETQRETEREEGGTGGRTEDSLRLCQTWWDMVVGGGWKGRQPFTGTINKQGLRTQSQALCKLWGSKKEFLFIIYTPPTSKENFKGDSQWKPHMKQDHWVKNWKANPWGEREEVCIT